jgi:hypothetical protein
MSLRVSASGPARNGEVTKPSSSANAAKRPAPCESINAYRTIQAATASSQVTTRPVNRYHPFTTSKIAPIIQV